VEISGEAIDSPQSLITEQVAAGLVVRMAILYELLAGRPERPALGEGIGAAQASAPTIGQPA
jgi:aspartate carbamoyltransferase catalytic subunit